MENSSNPEYLQESLLFELARAMALPQTHSVRSLIRLIFGRASLKVAKMALDIDREIGQNGTAAGARLLLPNFVAGYGACGQEIIPSKGPLLIVSNHPASYDGVVISAFVNRPDFKIMIGEIPPYRYLPHISRHANFSPLRCP